MKNMNRIISCFAVAFAFGVLLAPQAVQAQGGLLKHALTDSYIDFALINEWVRISEEKTTTTNDNGNLETIVTYSYEWEAGYEPTGDKDNDDLTNQREWDGWSTTINGQYGWFSNNRLRVQDEAGNPLPNVVHFGPGPDIEAFDSDCDGISDYYEREARTNPHSNDTDGDGLFDAVELYAGISALDDGWVYCWETNDVGDVTREIMTNALGDKMKTIWHPTIDIDGDGWSTKRELALAQKAMKNYDRCPEKIGDTTSHFPWEELDKANWLNPLDCDTDGDWLLDSFEKSWKGLNVLVKESEGERGHFDSDPDKDGLTTFREQALHPLLSYSWVHGDMSDGWPFVRSKFKGLVGDDAPTVGKIGTRYSTEGRILEGTVGYLKDAKFNAFGDMQMWYKVTYDDKGNPTPELQGVPGTVQWPNPKTYWTCPMPNYVSAHDWDGDGLPDGWEVEHGLNPLSGIEEAVDDEESEDEDEGSVWMIRSEADVDPSGFYGDPDRDGLVNGEEYLGADGHRVDYITGTGDETIPWIARSINYPNYSSFDLYLNNNTILLRNNWQAPYRFIREGVTYDADGWAISGGLDTIYDPAQEPGFFSGHAMIDLDMDTGTFVPNMAKHIVWDQITGELFETEIPYLLPKAGVPAPADMLNDMEVLAEQYGPDFVARKGKGGFLPFATSYACLYYFDSNGDGRYTPLIDPLWYTLGLPFTDKDPNVFWSLYYGDLILSDPDGMLAAASELAPVIGRPVYENAPLMVPMPGWDTDGDGLPDSMELRMSARQDKQVTSPVHALSPLVSRSAKIIRDGGTKTLFTDYMNYFSTHFTVEAWVYLEGDEPASGSFIRGFGPMNSKEVSAYNLGIAPATIAGATVQDVPYISFHTASAYEYKVFATRPLPRGRWVHLAGVFNPNQYALSLYIDGVLEQSEEVHAQTSGAWLKDNYGSNGQLALAEGTGFADRLWLDEVRIWGVARTAEEVAANYNVILEGRQGVNLEGEPLIGGLMAYFTFDDGGSSAMDMRYRAMSSLQGYDFPAQTYVTNKLYHEYMYPDNAYALPAAELGGAFVFDAGRAAPIRGAVDSQRGDTDSDGDGLPDWWEVMYGFNPYSWYTRPHRYETYDSQWATVADAALLIGRTSLLEFRVSLDGGSSWDYITCPLVLSTANGVVKQSCCPNTLLAASYTSTTNKTDEVGEDGTTNVVETITTVTNWMIMSGDVLGSIAEGETWWVSTGGITVAPLNSSNQMISDADGDPDGDGLSNLQEYRARTNPRRTDTNQDGIPDSAEDWDGDGLPNILEVKQGSRVDLADTDDDGISDLEEMKMGTSPADSTSPGQNLAMYFGGKPGSYMEIRDATKYRLDSWTVEATVLPASVDFLADGQGATIFRRTLEDMPNGISLANYELRVVRDGANLYPEASYTYKTRIAMGSYTGTPIRVRGTQPLPVAPVYTADIGAQLAITYDASAKRLRLYVDGVLQGSRTDMLVVQSTSGEGPYSTLRIGEHFHGYIDELRVWNTERTAAQILAMKDEDLIGSETALAAYFSFNDGGWPNILTSNTVEKARCTNLLYSVKYLTQPAARLMCDGDTWLDGSTVYINDSGVFFAQAVTGPIFYRNGIVAGGPASEGDFGWNYQEERLYRFNGSIWVPWGQAPGWLSEARGILEGQVATVADIVNRFNPVAGDQYINTVEGVVYIYRETLPSDDGLIAEFLADPLLPGHRFYFRPNESIVEWDGTRLNTICRAMERDGMYINILSEGIAYKSESRVWRKWGFVPSSEDFTTTRGWESDWQTAAYISGAVDTYQVAEVDTTYVPPTGVDTDGDGLPDAWELRYGLDINDPGLGGLEYKPGIDIDGDTYPDMYIFNQADYLNGPWGDPDNDGLHNYAEYLAGTDPTKYDTDGDGIPDYDSSRTEGGATYGSLYTDGDNIPDAWESLFPTAASPFRFDANLDTDADGWNTYSEYMSPYLYRGANIYNVYTNEEDGTVTSNWVGADGYSVPYCDPSDASIYPKPNITFQFKTDCNVKGTLYVFAYTDPLMLCPDARLSYVLDEPLRNGNELSLTGWGFGYIRQGMNYFMGFVDENGNGQWDEGEVLGFSENMPENISWDSATVKINLSDGKAGLPRFSWASAGATNESIITIYRVNTVVYQEIRGGCASDRQYLHEYDYLNNAYSPNVMAQDHRWVVTDRRTGETNASGILYFSGRYPSTLQKPVVKNPIGTVVYAKERLRMTLPKDSTHLNISLKNAAGAKVVNKTMFAPYVDKDGIAEIDFPGLFGFGALTNGTYRLQVTVSNPAPATATSDEVTLVVALNTPAQKGVSMISGQVHYFGWSPNANIIVEAFRTPGFDQKPIARTYAAADGTYRLMGVPLGETYVRAFQDQNNNGVFDEGESWGLVKGKREDPYAFRWGSAVMKGLLFRESAESGGSIRIKGGSSRTASATIYSVDYSTREIMVEAIRNYENNDLVIHDPDSDNDGLPDTWELVYAGNLTVMNQTTDMDGDGLLDIEEFQNGTHPGKKDTDGDGLTDYQEVKLYGTNPLNPDSDADGLSDGDEVTGRLNTQYNAEPTNPVRADSDGDGLTDADEIHLYGTDPNNPDTDGDGLPDGWEVANGFDPLNAVDAAEDADGDGLTNLQEYLNGTDPWSEDSDGDGYSDGWEIANGYDPLDPDDPGVIQADLRFLDVNIRNAADMEIVYEANTAPLTNYVQSATNLSETPVFWTDEHTSTVTTVGTYTNLIPATVDGPVKYYRIIGIRP